MCETAGDSQHDQSTDSVNAIGQCSRSIPWRSGRVSPVVCPGARLPPHVYGVGVISPSPQADDWGPSHSPPPTNPSSSADGHLVIENEFFLRSNNCDIPRGRGGMTTVTASGNSGDAYPRQFFKTTSGAETILAEPQQQRQQGLPSHPFAKPHQPLQHAIPQQQQQSPFQQQHNPVV